MAENLLGEYLRAGREFRAPNERGMPHLGRRRVPGLRREELAMLAGISAEYYIRLELGSAGRTRGGQSWIPVRSFAQEERQSAQDHRLAVQLATVNGAVLTRCVADTSPAILSDSRSGCERPLTSSNGGH